MLGSVDHVVLNVSVFVAVITVRFLTSSSEILESDSYQGTS